MSLTFASTGMLIFFCISKIERGETECVPPLSTQLQISLRYLNLFLREVSKKPFVKLNLNRIVRTNRTTVPIRLNGNHFALQPLNIKGPITVFRMVVYDNGGMYFDTIASFH